jgi:glucose/arabinose dehydrogenase
MKSLSALCILLVSLALACDDPPPPPVAPTAKPPVDAVEPAAPTEPAEPTPAANAADAGGETAAAAVPAVEPPVEIPASRLEEVGPYMADVGRDCDGEAHLALRTAPGLCVGVAVHKETPGIARSRGRFRPRTLLEDPSVDGRVWVVDAGAKRPKAGRIWRMERGEEGWAATIVLSKLDRPHGSAIGPDGWIYVGEIHRVLRFDPSSPTPEKTVETVVDELPTQLRGKDRIRYHPLKAFVFTPGWDLILNMGSHTDRCLEALPIDRCPDELDHTAALWRFPYRGRSAWEKAPGFIAHGLRNSVALATHASSTVLQAENGSDFRDDGSPREELNVIVKGGHYGWPYCFDRKGRDPKWAHSSFQCDGSNPDYRAPHLLLPAHAAPLDLHYYGAGGLAQLRGKLLISYHGYRATGHRIVALDVDEKGIPAKGAMPEEIVAGWAASDTGPKGGPVGLWRMRDGAVMVADDRNGTLVRISADTFSSARDAAVQAPPRVPAPAMDAAFVALHQDIFSVRCASCHEIFAGSAQTAWASLHQEGWLGDGSSPIAAAIGPDAVRPMPPDAPLSAAHRARLETWLGARKAGP